MTAPNNVTYFVQNGTDKILLKLYFIYTPKESLTQILLKGERIEHLAWKDTITDSGIVRAIYFDYYKEPGEAPKEVKEPVQQTLGI